MHLGPPVLDKVERSWSCWRHPNASGVGVNVACAMGNTRFSQAPGDFLEGGCGRVSELTTETYFDVIREPRTNNTMMFLKRLVVARP